MSIVTFRAVHSRALWLVLAALALAVILVVASPAQPAAASCGGTTTVGTEAELNAAIGAYNAAAAPCLFTIQLTGNIALTASTTQINNATAGVSLVIEGGGFAVSGPGTSGSVRPFEIAVSTRVTMNAITVTGGNVNGNGGGISNNGILTLADSTINGNTVSSPNSGGGIFNGSDGTLAVTRSTISNNTAGNEGGGIGNRGALTVTDSTITGNTALILEFR